MVFKQSVLKIVFEVHISKDYFHSFSKTFNIEIIKKLVVHAKKFHEK